MQGVRYCPSESEFFTRRSARSVLVGITYTYEYACSIIANATSRQGLLLALRVSELGLHYRFILLKMSSSHEKERPDFSHNEEVEPSQTEDNNNTLDDTQKPEYVREFTQKEMRGIRRRADLRLIPALGLMYGISLMDRKNVSNAAIAGMLDDLKLNTGYGYSTITLMFFVSYVIFQPAMTVLCRKIGPKVFLSSICIAWGAPLLSGLGLSTTGE